MESFLLKVNHNGTSKKYKLLNEYKDNTGKRLDKVLDITNKMKSGNFTSKEYYMLAEEIFTKNGFFIVSKSEA
jgi:hypothetical protein